MRSTWAGAGVTAALVVPGVVLGAAHGDVRSVLSYAPMALGFGVVGSVVLASRPRHPVGVLFSTTGVVVAFLLAVEQLARTGAALAWPTGVVSAAAWLAVWPIELTVGLVVFSFLLFPDGRLPSSRWRPVLLAAGVTTGVGVAMAALTPVNFDAGAWGVPPPLALLSSEAVSPAFGAYRVASLVLLAVAALSLVARWRCGGPATRLQVGWVGGAAVVTVCAVLLTFPLGVEPSTATRLLLPAIPVAAGVAVLQGRLYEVDAAAPRTLLYGTVSVLLAASLLVLAVSAGRLLDGPLSAVGVTAGVLLAGEVVRRRLQRRLDASLLGDPDLPALAQRLTSLVPGEARGLLQELCAQLAVQLGRAHVAVEQVGADGGSGLSAVGSETGHHLDRIPLLHAGEQVGTLVMSQSELRWLRRGQRRAVRQLLPYVALVAAAARLSDERDAARREVVSVREEERAELRRLLHDAAAGLSGVALQLDVAADDVTAERAEQLARMREEVSGVARTMRGLAYEMGPPALADAGLVEALARTVAALPSRPGQPWEVEVRGGHGQDRLPSAVAVAAYRVAVEAVHNAYRHSGARRCTIDVEVDGDLRLMVCDDGRGLPVTWQPGVGVAGMRERAQELGGWLRLGAGDAGGTVVELRLPVQRQSG